MFVQIVSASVAMEKATVEEDSTKHDHMARANIDWAAHSESCRKINIENVRFTRNDTKVEFGRHVWSQGRTTIGQPRNGSTGLLGLLPQLDGRDFSFAAVKMDSQVATTEPKLMIVADTQAVTEAVEDADLCHLEVRLEPPCLLKKSYSHDVKLSPVEVCPGRNNTVRLSLKIRVKRNKIVYIQLLIHL
ncbi:hypothetical protein [Rhizobium leguminosarum]